MLNTLFQVAIATIEAEHEELAKIIPQKSEATIWNLFETSLVYLIWKRLLERRVRVDWERLHGAKGSRQRIDLVVTDRQGRRIGVEVKVVDEKLALPSQGHREAALRQEPELSLHACPATPQPTESESTHSGQTGQRRGRS